MAKKAIIQKGRDNTRIPIPVSDFSSPKNISHGSADRIYTSGPMMPTVVSRHLQQNPGFRLMTMEANGAMLPNKVVRSLSGHSIAL